MNTAVFRTQLDSTLRSTPLVQSAAPNTLPQVTQQLNPRARAVISMAARPDSHASYLPVPESATDCGDEAALSAMLKVAV